MIEALRNGTRLHCSGGRSILLLEEINRGGNAITYSAQEIRIDGTPDPRSFVVKEAVPADAIRFMRSEFEAVPADADRFIRDDFEVVPSSKGDADASNLLRLHRDALIEEQNNGSALANVSSRVYGLWERLPLEAISYGNEKREITLEEQDRFVFGKIENLERKGTFLSSIMRDQLSFYQTAVLIQKLLEALSDCHAAHVLHGDVSPGNVFFETKKNPKAVFGEAYLTDFATAKSVGKYGKTAPILCPSSTRRYAAPEFYTATPQLSLSFDVFSVAALWLDMLGLLPESRDMDTDLYLFVRSSLDEKIIAPGGTRACIPKAKDILKKALRFDCSERYQTAAEMLEPVNDLVVLLKPPEYLLAENLGLQDSLYPAALKNRAEQLQLIDNALQRASYFYIYGMGGIGKSSLSVVYAKSRFPGKSYRIFFNTSFTETISSLSFLDDPVEETDPEKRLRQNLSILSKQYRGSLLIIDNVTGTPTDWSCDPTYQALLNLRDIKLLFTTRINPQDEQMVELQEPEHEDLLDYFCDAVGDERMTMLEQEYALTRPALLDRFRNLLQAISYHPLTAEVMAKTLSRQSQAVSLKQLEEALSHLPEAKLPRVIHTVDNRKRDADVYHHIALLFNLQKLSEAEITLLRHASLFPDSGIDETLLLSAEDDSIPEALDILVYGSLLRSDLGIVSVHAIIREVIKGELNPTESQCSPFLERLWEAFQSDGRKNPDKWRQTIPIFVNAHRMFSKEDLEADNAFRAAKIMNSCRERLEEAIALSEYAAERREHCKNYPAAASAHRLVCDITLKLDFLDENDIGSNHAWKAYWLDYQCPSLDLSAMARNYYHLERTQDFSERFEYHYPHMAELIVTAILLYRTDKALENYLIAVDFLPAIFVSPEEDREILANIDVLIDEERFLIERKKLNSPERRHFDYKTEAVQEERNKIPFSLDAYLHILDYYSNGRVNKPALYLDSFLSALSSFMCENFTAANVSLEELIQILLCIVKVKQELYSDLSCSHELMMIGNTYRTIAQRLERQQNRPEFELFASDYYLKASAADFGVALSEAQKQAVQDASANLARINAELHRSEYYLKAALTEAEKKPGDDVSLILANLADLELARIEIQTTTNELGGADNLTEEALDYAVRAIELCRDLPSEPRELRLMRLGFEYAHMELPPRESIIENDPKKVASLFNGTDELRLWFHTRENRTNTQRRKNALSNYGWALERWAINDALDLRLDYLSFLDASKLDASDERWLNELEAQIAEQPERKMLFPYHVEIPDSHGTRILRNAIRCNYCEEVLESAGRYAAHRIKTCRCNSVGIDGGHFMLVRFTKTPGADDYEELAEFEPTEDI